MSGDLVGHVADALFQAAVEIEDDKGTLGIRLHRAGHILGSVYGVEAQAG